MPLIEYIPFSHYDLTYTVPLPLPWDPTIYCLIAAVSSLPMWMTIELTFQIFATFKKYSGLYFWSLLITTWSITFRQVLRILIDFVPGCDGTPWLIVALLGWVGTVTGFGIVLYSRLHLVTRSQRILRGVLFMVCFDVFAFHLPMIVAQVGYVSGAHPEWAWKWYPATEKSQIIGFTVQESIISIIYIYCTSKMVHDSYNPRTKRCIRVFIAVQIACFLLDLPFVVLAYLEIYLIKAALTSFAYAIKLKLEFIVLNQLLGIVKQDPAAPAHDLHPDILPSPGSDTTLTPPSPRRMSLSPFWRKPSLAPATPPSGLQPQATPSNFHLNEKIWVDTTISVTPELQRNLNNSGSNTLTNSTIAHGSADDIFVHNDDDDKSFTDIEKQYLGRYGQNVPSSSNGR